MMMRLDNGSKRVMNGSRSTSFDFPRLRPPPQVLWCDNVADLQIFRVRYVAKHSRLMWRVLRPCICEPAGIAGLPAEEQWKSMRRSSFSWKRFRQVCVHTGTTHKWCNLDVCVLPTPSVDCSIYAMSSVQPNNLFNSFPGVRRRLYTTTFAAHSGMNTLEIFTNTLKARCPASPHWVPRSARYTHFS